MTGYMHTMHGNIYEGRFKNGESNSIFNGTLVVFDTATGTFKLPTADAASEFICIREVSIFDNIPAYDITVGQNQKKQYYLVENMLEYNDALPYDTTEIEVAPGAFVRAHPLLPGDGFYATSSNTLSANTVYGVTATGEIG